MRFDFYLLKFVDAAAGDVENDAQWSVNDGNEINDRRRKVDRRQPTRYYRRDATLVGIASVEKNKDDGMNILVWVGCWEVREGLTFDEVRSQVVERHTRTLGSLAGKEGCRELGSVHAGGERAGLVQGFPVAAVWVLCGRKCEEWGEGGLFVVFPAVLPNSPPDFSLPSSLIAG